MPFIQEALQTIVADAPGVVITPAKSDSGSGMNAGIYYWITNTHAARYVYLNTNGSDTVSPNFIGPLETRRIGPYADGEVMYLYNGDGGVTCRVLIVRGSGDDFVSEARNAPDHGELQGLADDDHVLLHNDARGDARYFKKSEHLITSVGAGSGGAPIKLDGNGLIDASMIDGTGIDHGQLAGKADDDHTQYHTNARGDARYFPQAEFTNIGGAPVANHPVLLDAGGLLDASMIDNGDIDHGSIGGLADDDHVQYLNTTRGDARYYQETEFKAVGGAGSENAPVLLNGAGYLGSSLIVDSDIDHGSITGLADDDHVQYHTDGRGDVRYEQLSVLKFKGTVTGTSTPPTNGELTAALTAVGEWCWVYAAAGSRYLATHDGVNRVYCAAMVIAAP